MRAHNIQMAIDVVQFSVFNVSYMHEVLRHSHFGAIENTRFVHVVPREQVQRGPFVVV